MKTRYADIVSVLLLATGTTAFAQTEFHFQYGAHLNPFSGSQHRTRVVTRIDRER